jgi:hydrogenase maturation protease
MGIGNLLMGDDGLRVHAARALTQVELPETVAVLDVGTAFLDILPELEDAERIIVMDAMQAHGEPGTIYRFYSRPWGMNSA